MNTWAGIFMGRVLVSEVGGVYTCVDVTRGIKDGFSWGRPFMFRLGFIIGAMLDLERR